MPSTPADAGTPLTDEQVMVRLQAGDRGALDELYARYARTLHVFCACQMGVRDAEDVVHDVFVRLIRSARQFDVRRGTLRSWLFGIARHRCIDLDRRNRIVRWTAAESPVAGTGDAGRPDQVPDPREDAETRLVADSVGAIVRACLDEIRSPEARQALTLYYLAGKVLREIGEVLGKSTTTAKNYVEAARRQVKACLERKGITAPDSTTITRVMP